VYANGQGSPRRRLAKRIAIAVIGGTITFIGVAMIVLPGPAIIVIPIGLSILATEFVWARRYLRKCRATAKRWKDKVRARTATESPVGATASGSAAVVHQDAHDDALDPRHQSPPDIPEASARAKPDGRERRPLRQL